jgi:hypothetical protein
MTTQILKSSLIANDIRIDGLLNRIQAGDLKSFVALKAPTEMPKLSALTDEEELRRLGLPISTQQEMTYDDSSNFGFDDDPDFSDAFSELGYPSTTPES